MSDIIRFSIGEVYSEDLSSQLGKIEDQVDDGVYMLIKAGTGGLQKGSALSIDEDYLASAVESEVDINGVAVCDVPEDYYSLVQIKGVNVLVNGNGSMAANEIGVAVGSSATKGVLKPHAPQTSVIKEATTGTGGTDGEVAIVGLASTDPILATCNGNPGTYLTLSDVTAATGKFTVSTQNSNSSAIVDLDTKPVFYLVGGGEGFAMTQDTTGTSGAAGEINVSGMTAASKVMVTCAENLAATLVLSHVVAEAGKFTVFTKISTADTPAALDNKLISYAVDGNIMQAVTDASGEVSIPGLQVETPVLVTLEENAGTNLTLCDVEVATGKFTVFTRNGDTDARAALVSKTINYMIGGTYNNVNDDKIKKGTNIIGMGADALTATAVTVYDPISGDVIKATAATTDTEIFFLDPNNMLSTLFHVGDTLDGCIAGDEIISAIDEATPATGTTRLTIANTQAATNVPATRKKVEGLCRLV